MSSYHRAKREDFNKSEKKQMSVALGSVKDSFDTLKSMCNDKSVELLKSIELNHGEVMEVVFWTEDIPELIGVSTFTKNENGLLSYSFDESLRTI